MLLNNDFIVVVQLVPSLTFADVTLTIKSPSGSTFVNVPITASDFTPAEDDYYNIRVNRSFITENGIYIIQGTAGTARATAASVYSTKATASRPGLSFVAVTPGVIGNSIILNFNGTDTVATVATAWNMDPANAGNLVTYTGAGATVLGVTTVTLTGGTDGNAVTFDAVKSGPVGNSISLVFDGLKTTKEVCDSWNNLNPNNKVSYTAASAGGYVSASTVTLAGGTEIPFSLQNECFPWGSSEPSTCMIYGNVTDVGGAVQPYAMVAITIWPVRLPVVKNNTMLLGQKLTTYADTNGDFELVAVIGATVVIEVALAGFRLQTIVPDKGSVPLSDLIPVVTPPGVTIKTFS